MLFFELPRYSPMLFFRGFMEDDGAGPSSPATLKVDDLRTFEDICREAFLEHQLGDIQWDEVRIGMES